jgi:hypothetical protein
MTIRRSGIISVLPIINPIGLLKDEMQKKA